MVKDSNVSSQPRMSPQELSAMAREWMRENGQRAELARTKLAQVLKDYPIHTSLLSSVLDGFNVPKPVSSFVRECPEFVVFKVSDNGYIPGQPAVALKSKIDIPGYWQRFKKTLAGEGSPWAVLGIPAAGANIGLIRYEIFAAFLRSIDPTAKDAMLTSGVMDLFQKRAGMRFADFFGGRPGVIAEGKADQNKYLTWEVTDDEPPLLSVKRTEPCDHAPLTVVSQLALRELRREMVGKAPEAVEFERIQSEFGVDRDSLLYAYLRELGVALKKISPSHSAKPEPAPAVYPKVSAKVESSAKIVSGKILFVSASGAGVDVNGTQGYLPKSEISWDYVSDPSSMLMVGGTYRFKVIPDYTNNGGLFLSLKQMTEDPWKTVASRFPIGKAVTGIVTRYTPNDDAALVSLAPGVTGRLQLREMSPRIRKETASASIPKGTSVIVAVLAMNREKNWLQLTMNVVGTPGVSSRPAKSTLHRKFLVDGSSLVATIGVPNTCKVISGLLDKGYDVGAFFAADDFHAADERRMVEEGLPKTSYSILPSAGKRGAFLLFASKHTDEIISNTEYADSKFPISGERIHAVSEAFGELLLPTLGLTFPAV